MATTLIESAKNGQLEVIRQLVEDGYDVNHKSSPEGATPLYWAACNGHLSTCDWLIRHGADVNQSVEKSGSIPLHGAADRGHVECLLLLIRRGSRIDTKTRSNGDTPLHLAAYRGHVAVCRALLQNGACADILNAQGCTALDEAQIQNHYDIYQLLCKHRQRSLCSTRQRKSETCQLIPTAYRSSASFQKGNKLITEVLSPSSDWDQTDKMQYSSHESSSSNRLFSGDKSTAETADRKHSTNLDMSVQNLENCQETPLVQTESKANDLNAILRHSVPPCPSAIRMSSKTDDVIQELVTKFNQLVAYSSDLQLQLTVREDEKDRLLKENENLIERLECCKKIAKAVEASNLARMESERRALRAERELVLIKQRHEELEKLNRTLENRILSTTYHDRYSSTRNFSSEDYGELQPRGIDSCVN